MYCVHFEPDSDNVCAYISLQQCMAMTLVNLMKYLNICKKYIFLEAIVFYVVQSFKNIIQESL